MTSTLHDIQSGEFDVRAENFRAYRKGIPLDLRQSELRLLVIFLQRRGQILSRSQIRDAFDSSGSTDERSIDVYVMRLRKALNTGRMRDAIETVKGRGYRFRALSPRETAYASTGSMDVIVVPPDPTVTSQRLSPT